MNGFWSFFEQRRNSQSDVPVDVVCLTGLDCAGKTSFLYKLIDALELVEDEDYEMTIPAIGFCVERLMLEKMRVRSPFGPAKANGKTEFNSWDCGGKDKIRPLWRYYYAQAARGVIFMVDARDHERVADAADEFAMTCKEIAFGGVTDNTDMRRENRHGPGRRKIMVLMNKCDFFSDFCHRIDGDPYHKKEVSIGEAKKKLDPAKIVKYLPRRTYDSKKTYTIDEALDLIQKMIDVNVRKMQTKVDELQLKYTGLDFRLFTCDVLSGQDLEPALTWFFGLRNMSKMFCVKRSDGRRGKLAPPTFSVKPSVLKAWRKWGHQVYFLVLQSLESSESTQGTHYPNSPTSTIQRSNSANSESSDVESRLSWSLTNLAGESPVGFSEFLKEFFIPNPELQAALEGVLATKGTPRPKDGQERQGKGNSESEDADELVYNFLDHLCVWIGEHEPEKLDLELKILLTNDGHSPSKRTNKEGGVADGGMADGEFFDGVDEQQSSTIIFSKRIGVNEEYDDDRESGGFLKALKALFKPASSTKKTMTQPGKNLVSTITKNQDAENQVFIGSRAAGSAPIEEADINVEITTQQVEATTSKQEEILDGNLEELRSCSFQKIALRPKAWRAFQLSKVRVFLMKRRQEVFALGNVISRDGISRNITKYVELDRLKMEVIQSHEGANYGAEDDPAARSQLRLVPVTEGTVSEVPSGELSLLDETVKCLWLPAITAIVEHYPKLFASDLSQKFDNKKDSLVGHLVQHSIFDAFFYPGRTGSAVEGDEQIQYAEQSRCVAHTDKGALLLLLQDERGLQVRKLGKDGWKDCHAETSEENVMPGFVLLGRSASMIDEISGGEPCEHHVLGGQTPRCSISVEIYPWRN